MTEKRILRIGMIAVCLFSLLTLTARAASGEYSISELDLTVSIPEEYDVFTLNMPENDPLLSDYNTTKADMEAMFSDADIYLNAVSTICSEEIVVTMTENSFTDFFDLSDTVLRTMGSSLAEQYMDYGIVVTEYDVYHNDQFTFIQNFYHDTAETVHGIQFYTISNHQAINFTIRSYEGDITDEQKATMYAIVDSVRRDSVAEAAPLPEAAPSFLYTDADSGASFIVPEGWSEKPLSESREFLDVKFMIQDDPTQMILYGSADYWSQLSSEERARIKRSELNFDNISKEFVEERFGIYNAQVDAADSKFCRNCGAKVYSETE